MRARSRRAAARRPTVAADSASCAARARRARATIARARRCIGRAGELERQHDVLQRRQRRQQLERLEHEAEQPLAQRGAAVLVERRQRDAVDASRRPTSDDRGRPAGRAASSCPIRSRRRSRSSRRAATSNVDGIEDRQRRIAALHDLRQRCCADDGWRHRTLDSTRAPFVRHRGRGGVSPVSPIACATLADRLVTIRSWQSLRPAALLLRARADRCARTGSRASASAGAARRRRLDFRRLRPRAKAKAGSICSRRGFATGRPSRARRQRVDLGRHDRRRTRATARVAARASAVDRRHRARRQRRAARRRPARDARESRRDGRRPCRRRARKPLIVGMKVPPNYGPSYARTFDALFADVAKARRVPRRAVRVRGLRRRPRAIPGRPHPSAGRRRRRASSTTSGRRSRRCCRATMIAPLPPGSAAAPDDKADVDDMGVVSASASTFARPASSPTITCPGAINLPVLDDAERAQVGTMYVQLSAFDARKVGAAIVARNIARIVETLRARQAARLGAARLLLARRPAQPRARARAERDRLSRRAARRRLSRVPAARRRAARAMAAAVSLIASSAA